MEANKILNADILDLIFEDRNKEYGAYDLRKTYNKRILKALIITASVALLALLGSLLAKAFTGKNKNVVQHEITLQEIKEEEKKPDAAASASSKTTTTSAGGNGKIYSPKDRKG